MHYITELSAQGNCTQTDNSVALADIIVQLLNGFTTLIKSEIIQLLLFYLSGYYC